MPQDVADPRSPSGDESHMPDPPAPAAKLKPGEKWKADEVQDIPHNNLWIVFSGLVLCVFLAALDQTIVSTALPTIVADFGSSSGYSWVGSAYLVCATALAPAYGKFADVLGRKITLMGSLTLFLLGSALCGAAKSITWLIIARGVQGSGGGGIIQLVQITVSDITALQDRGKYAGLLGATWGVASVLGPLIGGALTQHASWRYCFYINLPTVGIAAGVLLFSLNVPHKQRMTFREHVAQFDFFGLFLLLAGIILLLIGFNGGETDWRKASTIAPLTIGGALLVVASIWECYTSRSPIIPPRLFKTRTTGILLTSVLLHGVAFFAAAYYIPLYFQFLGSSPTKAGIQTMPYSLGASLASIVSGFIVAKTREYKPMELAGFAIATVGYGLLWLFRNPFRSGAVKEIIMIIPAIGIGVLFQTPLIGLQSAMPLKDMPTSTATLGLLRTLGATLGISIGQTIFTTYLRQKLPGIPGYGALNIDPTHLTAQVRSISQIQPETLRNAVLAVCAESIALVFIVMVPLMGICFFSMFFLRRYSLERNVRRESKSGSAPTVESEGPVVGPMEIEPIPLDTREDIEKAESDGKVSSESPREARS